MAKIFYNAKTTKALAHTFDALTLPFEMGTRAKQLAHLMKQIQRIQQIIHCVKWISQACLVHLG